MDIRIGMKALPHRLRALPNMFCNLDRTGSANIAEQVRPIWPNLFGHIGRTLAEPFGLAEHSSAKKRFGSAETGFGRSLEMRI